MLTVRWIAALCAHTVLLHSLCVRAHCAHRLSLCTRRRVPSPAQPATPHRRARNRRRNRIRHQRARHPPGQATCGTRADAASHGVQPRQHALRRRRAEEEIRRGGHGTSQQRRARRGAAHASRCAIASTRSQGGSSTHTHALRARAALLCSALRALLLLRCSCCSRCCRSLSLSLSCLLDYARCVPQRTAEGARAARRDR